MLDKSPELQNLCLTIASTARQKAPSLILLLLYSHKSKPSTSDRILIPPWMFSDSMPLTPALQ